MNYQLLFTFLIFQVIEFSVFYGIALLTNFPFLALVGADIILTVLFFGNAIPLFIEALFKPQTNSH
jgi:hypothetical protein